ncbi:hypothetical protein AC482_05605 [miscellaneous Crenarchaeota group-15 archaeon DG-45]|uniref:CARDB domain-containing protein n=1 Tax=miscellaneous Crenarchaeota group-15 archaeon DG-45 TaxID=1685127 RepID=A0A0M0BN91_9ARCH|nr:MAG: hypothetical protein AC482_05605 [miscellaneous Crenarchaeota group-15 archaeon DG-45]
MEHEDLSGDHDALSEQFEDLERRYAALSREHEGLLSRYDDLQSSYDDLLDEYERLVGSVPLSPEPASVEAIDREYQWLYGGRAWTLALSIPESLYEYYRSLDRPPTEDYSVYVTHPYDDEYIGVIVERFNLIAIDRGYTEAEKVNLVIAFVQSLPYTSDKVTTPFDEYPRYPLETLVDGGGDCEDTSILTAALLDRLNYDIVLLGLPEHMAVGVYMEGALGAYYLYETRKYLHLETTSEGWRLGESPPEYQGASAYIYPLLPVPVLTHSWTAVQRGLRITLTVTVKNVGSAQATGIKAYAAFDAGGGEVSRPVESEAFNLHLGREATVKLILNAPRNEYTRLIVGILDSDGFLVDESYSEWFQTS